MGPAGHRRNRLRKAKSDEQSVPCVPLVVWMMACEVALFADPLYAVQWRYRSSIACEGVEVMTFSIRPTPDGAHLTAPTRGLAGSEP